MEDLKQVLQQLCPTHHGRPWKARQPHRHCRRLPNRCLRSLTLTGVAVPTGGTHNGLEVASTPFAFSAAPVKIAYKGVATETIAWFLYLAYVVNPSASGSKTGLFWIDPQFQGITL